MRGISRVLSSLLHPLLIPTLGLFLIFNVGGHYSFLPVDHQRIVYLVVFLSTCILPLSLIPLFLMFKVIKSVYMEGRRERLLPVFFSGLFYFLGYFFLRRIPIVPSFIEGFMLATLMAIYVALIITFFWKISMHMIGIGGLAGAMMALSFRFGLDLWLLFSVIILASGLLGVARLQLKAHSPSQVYVGFVLGFLIVFSGIFLS